MYKRGSNQYQKRVKRQDIGAHFAFLGSIIFFFSIGNQYYTGNFPQKAEAIISPIASPSATLAAEGSGPAQPILADQTPELVEPAHPTNPQYEEIKKEIYEVFGKDADKAMKVLSCENASLNPEAVNTAGNSPAGSRDMGIFQINEYWQGVNGKFLLDPSINIRIARKIFIDNGGSFERWTCGRKFGI